MNPFASALIDFHKGNDSASFAISRDDGFHQKVPVSVFFADTELPSLERRALDLCSGRVLDIGAAAGRHSLQLIQRGFDVTSLDILPEVEIILRDRGLTDVVISDIFDFGGDRFDTLLMLMNGIGMVGTLDRLDRYLEHAHTITPQSGQIICDSINVSVTSDPEHSAYRQRNIDEGRPPGQQIFEMTYNEITGESFYWLHIAFDDLAIHASRSGWNAELVISEPNGHYLCTLTKNSG